MKTLNQFTSTLTFVALLGVANASAAELQPVTIEYGQGGPVTFLKPSAPNASGKYARAAKQGAATVYGIKDKPLLASPRYLEDHPELQRGQASREGTSWFKMDLPGRLTKNAALTNNPRYREEHLEARWVMPSDGEALAQNGGKKARSSKFAQTKALAASPRFREQHPEFVRGEPVLEVAPLM